MRRRAHHQCWGRCHCLHCAVQQAQGERARAATWLKLWGYWFSKREQQSRTKGRRTPSLLSYTVCLHSLLPSPHLLPSPPPSIFSFFFLALFVFPLWCSPEHKSWFKKKISFVLLKKGSICLWWLNDYAILFHQHLNIHSEKRFVGSKRIPSSSSNCLLTHQSVFSPARTHLNSIPSIK